VTIPMMAPNMPELQRNLDEVQKRMDDFSTAQSGKALTPAEGEQWLEMCDELRRHNAP
jgi:hypothetical protein